MLSLVYSSKEEVCEGPQYVELPGYLLLNIQVKGQTQYKKQINKNARSRPPQTMHRQPFEIFRVVLHSRAGAHSPRMLYTVAGLLTATDFSKLLIASSWNLVF